MEVLRIEWHRTSDEHGEGYMELILDKSNGEIAAHTHTDERK